MKNLMREMLCLLMLVLNGMVLTAQEHAVMFYNVENLFDCEDDLLKKDDDFLPHGKLHWTYGKYVKKQEAISKVIVAAGGWEAPALIGLCEVENSKVLYQLTRYGILAPLNYQVVHYESTDARGIDVALLYRPDVFKVLESSFIPVNFEEINYTTRDILFVRGHLQGIGEVYVFVNHWPSRRGGALASEWRRIRAAELLKKIITPLLHLEKQVIVMGDFNDTPHNKSILEVLVDEKLLINYMLRIPEKERGTYCFRGSWDCIDQFIVSRSLEKKIHSALVVRRDFMLKENKRSLISEPYRTYRGFKYEGGYSDHLPIILRFIKT